MNHISEKQETDSAAGMVIKIPAEVYSRVVGYFRPVNQWNKGKREEFSEREMYKI